MRQSRSQRDVVAGGEFAFCYGLAFCQRRVIYGRDDWRISLTIPVAEMPIRSFTTAITETCLIAIVLANTAIVAMSALRRITISMPAAAQFGTSKVELGSAQRLKATCRSGQFFGKFVMEVIDGEPIGT